MVSNSKTMADIVHDLNMFPYTFEQSSFDEIYIDKCLEYLDNVMLVMEEVCRICKSSWRV